MACLRHLARIFPMGSLTQCRAGTTAQPRTSSERASASLKFKPLGGAIRRGILNSAN